MTQTPAPMACTRRRKRELSRPIDESIVRRSGNLRAGAAPYDRRPDEQPARVAPARDGRRAGVSVGGRAPGGAARSHHARSCDSDTAAILLLEPGGEMLHARAAKGLEEEVEQGTPPARGTGLRRPHRGRAAGDRDPRRRPRRRPQPDPAREARPLAARRPAAGRGPGARRPACRQPDPARVHGRGPGAAPARRRPRGDRHRPRAPVRAGAQRPAAPGGAPARHRRRAGVPVRGRSAGRAARSRDRRAARRHGGDPHARRQRRARDRPRRQGDRGGGRAGRLDPGRARLRRPDRGRAAGRS